MTGISRDNRIPGSTPLTKPEEIQALGKFLKSVRETQDEYTEVDKTTLEMPGQTTGLMPKVESLEDIVDNLDVPSDDIKLDKTRITIKDNSTVNLGSSIVRLEDKTDIDLSNELIGLDTKDLISKLEEQIKNLGNVKTTEELSNLVEKLKADLPEQSLETEKIKIKDESKFDLEDKILGLEDNKKVELNTEKKELSVDDDKELETKRLDLLTNEKTELEKLTEKLLVNEEIGLSEKTETLEVTDNNELENKIYNIEVNDLESLGNEVKNLNVKEDPELENSVEDLVVKEIDDIDKKIEKLNASDEITLESDIETINPKDDPELENEKKRLNTGKDKTELSDFIDEILFSDRPTYYDNNTTPSAGEEMPYSSFLGVPDNKQDNYYDNNKETSTASELPYSEILGLDVKEDPELSEEKKDLSEDEHTYWGSLAGLGDYSSVVKNPVNDNKRGQLDFEDFAHMIDLLTALGIRIDKNNTNDAWLKEHYSDYDTERTDGQKRYTLEEITDLLTTDDAYRFLIAVLDDDKTGNRGGLDSKAREALRSDSTAFNKISSLVSSFLSSRKISESSARTFINKLDEAETILEYVSNSIKEGDTRKGATGYTINTPEYSLPVTDTRMSDFGVTGSLDGLNLQSGALDSININKYLRWTVENTVGKLQNDGVGLRRSLIEYTLAVVVAARDRLEYLSKANRDRLPGDDYGMVSDVVSSGASSVANEAVDLTSNLIQTSLSSLDSSLQEIDKTKPLNRPLPTTAANATGKHGYHGDELQETTAFDLGNNRKSPNTTQSKDLKSTIESIAKESVGGSLFGASISGRAYNFAKNYISGTGINTTLLELCKVSDTISSLEKLKETLITSPYVTTPYKFGTIGSGRYGSTTLDNNSFWEIIMEPYCGVLNGNYSFLPAIHEINTINSVEHGVETRYDRWIPFTNFELQKSKLTTKTLGLYDGEISYPVSLEYTNEFRVSIADDQFKSWRNYFQKCVDVSVYSSKPHDKDYYEYHYKHYDVGSTNFWLQSVSDVLGEKTSPTPTVVDRNNTVVAFYKNITFLITIFVMTPQYSTIRKFELLCVIKDFSEEFSGEVEPSAGDLSVGFSIVGENPSRRESGKPNNNPYFYNSTYDDKFGLQKMTEKEEEAYKNLQDKYTAADKAAKEAAKPKVDK